jgi:HEAT repeat protein
MRKMFRTEGPPPSIEEDIAALAGPDARRAGPRLIDRGPEVLDAVHEALLAPDLDPRYGLRLLQVIGPLEDRQSVPVVLELLRREPASPLRRDALLTLAMLPPTDDAAAFVLQLAADGEEDWRTRRMAYTWFGLHRDERGRSFAVALRDDPDPARRAAGLYVLARLGDASALDPIAQLLRSGEVPDSRDALLLGLAELTTPAEFGSRAPEALAWSDAYRAALLYSRYRHATLEEQPALCLELVRSSVPGHRGLGVRCLLDADRREDLLPLAALSLESPGLDALVRNEIRKAGWRVIDTDERFAIEPGPGTAEGIRTDRPSDGRGRTPEGTAGAGVG